MKRLLCAFFAVLLILPLCVNATRVPQYIFDKADVLTDVSEAEAKELMEMIYEVRDKHGISVAVLFVDSLDGQNEVVFADDFYDRYVYGYDGVLLLCSLEDDIRYVSTSGECIDAVDPELSEISDAIAEPYYNEDYPEVIKAFVTAVDDIMTSHKSSGLVTSLVISLAVGFIAAFIVTGVMKSQLDGAKFNNRAEEYVKRDSMKINVSRDLFLYRTVNRIPKPKNNSSTHKSSSGRSHGGGRV